MEGSFYGNGKRKEKEYIEICVVCGVMGTQNIVQVEDNVNIFC